MVWMTTAPGGTLGVLCHGGHYVVSFICDSRCPKAPCFIVPGGSLWLKLTQSENDVSLGSASRTLESNTGARWPHLMGQVPRLVLPKTSLGSFSVSRCTSAQGGPCPPGTHVLGPTVLPGPWWTHWFRGNVRGPGCCLRHGASRSRVPETEAAVLTSQSCCLSRVLEPVHPERGSGNLRGSCLFQGSPTLEPPAQGWLPDLQGPPAGSTCRVRSQRDTLVQIWGESDAKGAEIAFSFFPWPALTWCFTLDI